jgi:hypothetical protein
VSSTTVFENVESCKKEDEKHILFAWHARAARLLRSPSPTRQMSRLLATCAACAAAYFAWVLSVVAPHAPRLFAPRFGRGHRLAGAAHLVLLLVGVADLLARVSQASFGASARPPLDLVALPLGRARVSGAFLYDALLGVSGCALTITAASDFGIPRARLRNRASGALDDDQTVTREEIVEHLFYQVLNVTQMVFLRLAPIVAATHGRSGACASLALATAPWLFRSAFPVNRFSANYRRREPLVRVADAGNALPERSAGTTAVSSFRVRRLYRLKKAQYVFLKHVLQHGLNVGVVVAAARASSSSPSSLADTSFFRAYWLTLNTAFVMEFFMQTLVKKKKLSQQMMLRMNKTLMFTSSLAAAFVVAKASLVAAATSCALNVLSPARESRTVALALAAAIAVDGTWPPGWIAFLVLGVAPICAAAEKRTRAWGERNSL